MKSKKLMIGLLCMLFILSGCETIDQREAIGEAIKCEDRCNIDNESGKRLCHEEIVDMCNMKYPTKQYITYLIENQNKID